MLIAIIRIIDKNVAIIILPCFLWRKFPIGIILNYGKKKYGLKKSMPYNLLYTSFCFFPTNNHNKFSPTDELPRFSSTDVLTITCLRPSHFFPADILPRFAPTDDRRLCQISAYLRSYSGLLLTTNILKTTSC